MKRRASGSNRFRLSPSGVLVALVAAACASPGFANTGRVDFTIGKVTLTGADGRVQALAKGAEVKSGDKISSSSDGRAQIRFSDGAYVSLQPNSEFDIKDYRFEGKADGNETALFGLFKGALRTVTGVVGRINRNRYQISTPTATIGIRGTGGLIEVKNDGSTLVTGTSGIWSLTNNVGTLNIPAGSAGIVGPNPNLPPQQSSQGPTVPPPQQAAREEQPQLPPVRQGEDRTGQGTPIAVADAVTTITTITTTPIQPALVPLTSGPGYSVGAVFDSCRNGCLTLTPLLVDAVFDASGQMTQFPAISVTSTSPTIVFDTFRLGGTHAEFGSADGVLAWGRWTGDVFKNGVLFATYPANGGLHYVVGQPTTDVSMPKGVTFSYNLIGATSPTISSLGGTTGSGTAPGTFSGSLVGDFTNNTVGLNLTATVGAQAYNMMTTGFLQGNHATSEVVISGSHFVGSPVVTGPSCVGCTSGVAGLFAGNAATHAGLVYVILDPQGVVINGAAAFKR